jgi:hypothetical protein
MYDAPGTHFVGFDLPPFSIAPGVTVVIKSVHWRPACKLYRMTEKKLTLPEMALLSGTRVGLGMGIGLLVANCLTRDQRRSAGFALLAMGLLTTIPIALEIKGKAPISDRSLTLAS